MPIRDGCAAAREIRRREGAGARRIPIVAVTAHALQGDQERCLAAGMDGYISKPVKPEDLTRTVEEWCFHRERLECGRPESTVQADGEGGPQDRIETTRNGEGGAEERRAA